MPLQRISVFKLRQYERPKFVDTLQLRHYVDRPVT